MEATPTKAITNHMIPVVKLQIDKCSVLEFLSSLYSIIVSFIIGYSFYRILYKFFITLAGEPTANFFSPTHEFKKELAPNTDALPIEAPLAHTQHAPSQTLLPIIIVSDESAGFIILAADREWLASII